MNERHEPEFWSVVVAAGAGRRLGGDVPKQFLPLGRGTVLERSVRVFADSPDVAGVVVVMAADEVDGDHGRTVRRWRGVERVVAGGDSRAESVLRGIEATPEVPFVLVHDAARPMVTPSLVDAVARATRREGAAVPMLSVADTVRCVEADHTLGQTLNRKQIALAQTPQGSRRDWLLAALRAANRSARQPTDEAAALERDGHRVVAVAGEAGNFKITTQEDYEQARSRLEGRERALRIGTGFDVHRVADDRRLVLGGLAFDGEPGLEGHSDADVVLHAVMDALLGAAGLGDIGALFPPDDPQWKDAASTDLAWRVSGLVKEAGFEVVNVDLTLLAERPRIRGRVEEMRASIAASLSVDVARIGVKATTLEGLGALGRREGMGCQAVALIQRSD